jgi:Mg-dependent DNase
MFDAHCHLGTGHFNALVCTSRPDEYKAAASCGAAIGLLPPFSDEDREIFFRTLNENPGLPIGEIGLDRRIENIPSQMAFLLKALQRAKAENRPVTLHVVGHTDKLFQVLDQIGPLSLIWHSFTGSFETAREFMKRGGIISLSERSLASKDIARLLALPFLLETDMKTGQEEQKVLARTYEKAAGLKRLEVNRLEERIEEWMDSIPGLKH